MSRRARRAALACVVLSLLAGPASAQVYRCQRPSGAWITADACPGGDKLTLDSSVERLDNAALVLLYDQSKECADYSTVLHTQVMGKATSARDPYDVAALELFKKSCLSRGFKVPASAAIHAANQALHKENTAKMMRADAAVRGGKKTPAR
jgi:hypothetical protein